MRPDDSQKPGTGGARPLKWNRVMQISDEGGEVNEDQLASACASRSSSMRKVCKGGPKKKRKKCRVCGKFVIGIRELREHVRQCDKRTIA